MLLRTFKLSKRHAEWLRAALILCAIACVACIYSYKNLHQTGHYGALEVGYAVGAIALSLFWLALTASIVVYGVVLLVSRQKEWPAKVYVPAVIIASLLIWHFGVPMLQRTALSIYQVMPWGLAYNEALEHYRNLCMVRVQDDENSGHYEDDWTGHEHTCWIAEHRAYGLFPGPSWFFGSRDFWLRRDDN